MYRTKLCRCPSLYGLAVNMLVHMVQGCTPFEGARKQKQWTVLELLQQWKQ